jgi:hypothetical protein
LSFLSFFPVIVLLLVHILDNSLGMTGLVASAISWVQQKGNGEVRFGVETYYQVTTFFLVAALAALGGLVWWEKQGYLTKEQTPASSLSSTSTSSSSPLPDDDEERIRESEREGGERVDIPEREGEGERERLRGRCSTRKEILKEVLREGWFAGLNQFLICVMNYTILGILPYSASGYQDPAFKFELIFHLNVYSLSIGAITRYLSTHLRLYCIPLQTLIQMLLFVGVLIACLKGPSAPLDQSDTWLLVFSKPLPPSFLPSQ